ncbi:MAG: hybrid sensor histidine kinase/response regulator [Gemmatimonadales bacterium]
MMRRLWARLTRELSLRTVLLLLILGAGAYAAALSLLLTREIGSAASALGRDAESLSALLHTLAQRHDSLDHAEGFARQTLDVRARATPRALEAIRRLAAFGSVRQPLAGVPAAMHVWLARTDEHMSQLGNALTDLAALLELGRAGDVRRRLATVDSLHHLVDTGLGEARELANRGLVERGRALDAALREMRRAALLWLVIGALLVPVALFIFRRRIAGPLKQIETALTHVAEGDLNTHVAARHDDEVGRLAQHFNEMTRVLRDRAEEQGRFAAAGELLGGVAHEVNNPLMAIAAHAENRVADPGISEEQRAEMVQILRQARRASKLLRGLLRFVRASEREITNVNLNDVARGAMDLVSYRFGLDEITVGGHLDPNLPPVQGDAIKLEQVVVNLLSNAIDALRAIKPPRHLTVDTWRESGRVSALVGDNGGGIPPEVAPRLFRPFATTKGRRGTGLGLYISRQIAREAGGDLVLTSAPGDGARFVLSLPVAVPAVQAVPPGTPEAGPAPTGGAQRPVESLAGLRVLIVDDEEGVRRPMARFLARRGAHVEEAGDGEEAQAKLAAQAPDVILADLRMPRMGGVELYAKLEETRPELAARVLFLSGDISQLAEPGNTPVARERVLVKPVELTEIERRILDFVRSGA